MQAANQGAKSQNSGFSAAQAYKAGGITLYKWNAKFGSIKSNYYLAVLPQVEKPIDMLNAIRNPAGVKPTRTTRGTMHIESILEDASIMGVFYKPAREFETNRVKYKKSSIREARALIHIIESGRKAEEPLAVYFDSNGNQALITKKVDGVVLSNSSMSFEEKLDIFANENMMLGAKGIFAVDMSFLNIMVDKEGEAVNIDAEAYLIRGNRKMERDIERNGIFRRIANAALSTIKFIRSQFTLIEEE